MFGSSGGGVFALEAAARGLAYTKLALWEPPYIVDDSRSPVPQGYKEQLSSLLAAGRRDDMVALFYTHTLIYDAEITGDFSLPTARLAVVTVPTLVLDGGEAAWVWVRHGVQALAAALPHAQCRTLEGQPHNVDPAALAPVLAKFFVL